MPGSAASIAELASIPDAPVGLSSAEERTRRKIAVVGGYRILSKFGLDEGISGHITARDPEDPDTFWTAPFGRHFSQVRPEELLHVGADGTVLSGSGPLNRAAFVIHSTVHEARPDVIGAVHAHGLHGKAFSSLHRLLQPITQDACAFYQDHALYDEYHGVALDAEEGVRIAAALGTNKAVILSNHGHLTVGTSVEAAVWWYVSMERSMQAELAACAAGDPVVLHDKIAAQTFEAVGVDKAGWFAYSTIIQSIAAAEPDIFDARPLFDE
ncbi:class II aldolase/adducin family protein [Rhodococcus fascians]|uniref:class II aldolase/adducin family protein n=1 Tax=Rhodococcoides fascians TaxID=1828 RepID=UPI00196069B7|nr:class II aldolase/adducin family protein [Rhodococcus fascians]MBM7244293.1 class II aldolase/adducin family protein [Rhodococcus fascians]MBY3810350.1 class II aldolase/adducin family protein [Rhodococcus fascians]MBY3842027.1 class II aldolase/adducin family protein [Rhodococcus fascians]MBY3844478.1 class II aldolase/adducin family protein [Rhodococcus fascians]MBY3850424.1 class II aldolase/adducin family protein [Rhodococcus fascians]